MSWKVLGKPYSYCRCTARDGSPIETPERIWVMIRNTYVEVSRVKLIHEQNEREEDSLNLLTISTKYSCHNDQSTYCFILLYILIASNKTLLKKVDAMSTVSHDGGSK